ncbi:MAG: hypothetical protein U0797_26060 [Gemmataceae bacterium]
MTWMAKEREGHRLVEEEAINLESKKKEIAVYCFNPEYLFTLQRRSGKDAWVLTNLILRKDENEPIPDTYKDHIGQGMQHALFLLGYSELAQFVKQPTFKATNAARVTHDGDECVSIDFDNPHSLKEKPFEPVQGGTILLDPKRSWCLRGFQVRTLYSNAAGTERAEKILLRDSKAEGLPLPVQIVASRKDIDTAPGKGSAEFVSSTSTTFDLDESAPPAREEFRLTAFGLPEPPGARKPWRWHWWAAGAGVVCLAGSYLFRRLSRLSHEATE